MVKYYCPKCGLDVNKPIEKKNYKGSFLETNCYGCGARIISDKLKNFPTSTWL